MFFTHSGIDILLFLWYNCDKGGINIMLNNAHVGKYRSVKYCTELYHFNYAKKICPDSTAYFWKKFKCPNKRFEAIEIHNHEAPEFIYMKHGILFVTLGSESITLYPGDFLMIDPFELHTAQFGRDDDVEYRYVVLDMDCLAGTGSAILSRVTSLESGKLRFKKVIRASDPIAVELGELMDELGGLQQKTEVDDLMAVSLLCRMMALIFGKVGLIEAEERRDIAFIKLVEKYVNENFTQCITTTFMSNLFGYSKNYFCALFKKNFGLPFSNYLVNYRIDRAMIDYRSSQLKLSEIAEAVGFGNYCYFSHRFKHKTGISPTEYFHGACESDVTPLR